MRTFDLLVALFALLQGSRYFRRALVFLFPSVRTWGERDTPPGSVRRLRVGEELQALGFARIGVRRERGVWGALRSECDVYANAERAAFAEVFEGQGGGEAGIVFSSTFEDGAVVQTADHIRHSIITPRCQVGGLPDAPLEAVLAAHEVAVHRFVEAHGAPQPARDLEGRLAAARAWSARQGRRELRRTRAFSFGIFVLAAALFASAVRALWLGLR